MIKLKTELFDYQKKAVEKLIQVKVCALYMEMGTGKTRTALELIYQRLVTGKIKQVLWLCPYSMQKDLPELLSEHIEGFESFIKIAGIESLSSSQRLLSELMEYVESDPTYLVVDESLLTKNPFAYRTQNIIQLSQKCSYKMILNGTPISRNEADIFSQWYILDWRILGYKSYYSFSANHLQMDEDRPGRIVRVLNTDYLARKIAPYTYQCSKSDVLDLPQKIIHAHMFDLTHEQEEHYDKISETLIEQIDERRPETIYRLFGALQAITSGSFIRLTANGKHCEIASVIAPKDNPRIKTLMRILEEIPTKQAVIFCQYTHEIMDILEMLGERAKPFYGEMSQKERQESKNAFKDGKIQYLVANKACAKFGLNLQFCNHEIFYNNDFDWGTRAQAEDRLHRVGQTKDVHIYDICADNTIDKAILRCLGKKERLSDIIKKEIASHNDSKNILKAITYGHIEKEVNDAKSI